MLRRAKEGPLAPAIFWRKKASRSDLPPEAVSGSEKQENAPGFSSRRIFSTQSGGFA